jgi:hypothetical protein
MDTKIKTIIRISKICSIVIYLSIIIINGVGLGVSFILPRQGDNLMLNLSLANFPLAVIGMVPVSIVFGIIFAIILNVLSLVDKKFINKWFIIFSTLYITMAFFIFNGTWPSSWFYQLCYILIPLAIAIIVMKKDKWFKKSGVAVDK